MSRSTVVKMASSRFVRAWGRTSSHQLSSLSGSSATSTLSPPVMSSMPGNGPSSKEVYRMSRFIWRETMVTTSFRWADTSRKSCSSPKNQVPSSCRLKLLSTDKVLIQFTLEVGDSRAWTALMA